MKYYVLIHLGIPSFLSDEDGSPMPFDYQSDAYAATANNSACSSLGFTVIGWEEHGGISSVD